LHLGDVEVRHADVADLALLLQRSKGGPALLDVLVRVGPVDLVQVDGVDAEPAQARLTLAPDRVGLEAVADLAALVPDHAALGEDVRPLAHPVEGPGNDLL